MNHCTEDPSKMEAQLLQAVTGLNGAIFEDIYEAGQQTHIVIRMERRTHPCPVCGMPTDSVHDYREQLVRDSPAFGLQTVIHLKSGAMPAAAAANVLPKPSPSCQDASGPFRETARRCFPKAEIVADSFHVVQQATRAMENVRKRVQKDFAKERRKYFKRSRKLLLMHQDQPSPEQLEQVYGVMGSKDVHEAKKRLSDWFMAVNATDIGEFTECARTYADWMEEILNIFRTGLSNGYTEGCNNRIKVIKRNAYGMRNFERFRKRILHCMSS